MFKVDLHVHTLLGGDASTRPEQVVPLARRVGLDGVCITEHHDYNISRPFDRIAHETEFPIFRGMEYCSREGHLLVFGVAAGKSDLWPGLPMQHAIDWVYRKGGVAIPAHPFQTSLSGRCLGNQVYTLEGIVALETINASATREENRLAANAADQMGICGIGGSDAHGPKAIGRAYTGFPSSFTTTADLVEALRSRESSAHINRKHQIGT
jgi:predicted metal-dependent phosphoesterase TrpH